MTQETQRRLAAVRRWLAIRRSEPSAVPPALSVRLPRFSRGGDHQADRLEELHVGRYSEGVEVLPNDLHVGRYSDGLDAGADAGHIGRYSDGVEPRPRPRDAA